MRFDEVNLDENVLQGIEAMNFQEMTPVQEQTIPVILEGKDIIGCAQTGTGKTAAYTLPLLSRLVAEGNPDNHIRAVIMVPTRELAQQIDMQFEGFSYFLPISTTVVYGGGDGAGWDQQKKGLLMGADVVIATPGRLLSHIANSGIDLSQVSYFILDEADRMLDMGFFRRYHANSQTDADQTSNNSVFSNFTTENPAVSQTDIERSGRDQYRHFQTERSDYPIGLYLL